MIFRYSMALPGSAPRALEVCENYFRSRGGAVTRAGSSAIRVRGPLVLLSLDPRLYSRGNRVGLNPLALVSTLEGELETAREGTRLKLRLVSLRAWYFPGLALLGSVRLYQTHAPVLAWCFVAAMLVGNFGLVTWMLRVGLKQELQRCFEAG